MPNQPENQMGRKPLDSCCSLWAKDHRVAKTWPINRQKISGLKLETKDKKLYPSESKVLQYFSRKYNLAAFAEVVKVKTILDLWDAELTW